MLRPVANAGFTTLCELLTGFMNATRTFIWVGMIVGSTVGGFIPALWGESLFSVASMFFATVGGIFGIWLGYRLGR